MNGLEPRNQDPMQVLVRHTLDLSSKKSIGEVDLDHPCRLVDWRFTFIVHRQAEVIHDPLQFCYADHGAFTTPGQKSGEVTFVNIADARKFGL